MGIKGISKVIGKLKEFIPLESLPRVAIDASITIHRDYAVALKKASYQVDLFSEDGLERLGVLAQELVVESQVEYYKRLISGGVVSIHTVFDGDAGENKKVEHSLRRSSKERIKASFLEAREALDHPKMVKNLSWMVKLDDELLLQIKRSLSSLLEEHPQISIEFHQAEGEADVLCSKLSIQDTVDAVISRDTDMLAYGTKRLVTQLEPVMVGGVPHMETISLEKVLSEYTLNMAMFRDFCIMCGCDYNKKLYLVNPVNIMALIQKHLCIETVCREEKKDISILNHIECRRIFSSLEETAPEEEEETAPEEEEETAPEEEEETAPEEEEETAPEETSVEKRHSET